MKKKSPVGVGTNTPKKGKSKLFLIIVAALLGIVLTAGVVLGTVAIVREVRAVVSFEGVRLDAGVVNYLSATRKKDYMRILAEKTQTRAEDTPEYWASVDSEGRTYLDLLSADVEAYIRAVVIGTYIYDSAGALSESEAEYLDSIAEDVLFREAGGSVAKFDELASDMGFDFEDFRVGTEMVYKYRTASSLIYGSDGSGLTDAECESYLDTYSHVKLLFIRTDYEFATDSGGNYITENGEYVKYQLTEEQVAERVADIQYIRSLIIGLENNSDIVMSPTVMSTFIDKYDYSDPYAQTGYYMSSASGFVADSIINQHPDFVQMSANIALTALSMEIGEYGEVECPFGVCFIYRYENEPYAYKDTTLSDFFTDFYTDAAAHFYDEELRSLSGAVKVKKAFYEIDLVALPYNKSMYVL